MMNNFKKMAMEIKRIEKALNEWVEAHEWEEWEEFLMDNAWAGYFIDSYEELTFIDMAEFIEYYAMYNVAGEFVGFDIEF